MTAGKFSFLLGKPYHSARQSPAGMASGLTVGETPSAEVVRVSVYHDASSHDATFAAGVEADLFISDVHCSLVIGCVDIAKISSMSGKKSAAFYTINTKCALSKFLTIKWHNPY